MQAFVDELKTHYPKVSVRTGSTGSQLVKIGGVPLPGRPKVTTDVLVLLNPDFRTAGGRPPVYVAPGTTLANGAPGRNVSPVLIEGETWMQFSFNFPWKANDEPWKLVEAALRRFLKNE